MSEPQKLVDHRAVAESVLEACGKYGLNNDQTTKCLIYTAAKLIQERYGCSDVKSAEMLSRAALYYRDQIKQVKRMFQNKG